MAYSVTKASDGDVSLGNLRAEIVTLQPAASDYPSGGYAISTANVGLSKILLVAPIGGQGGFSPIWNPSTGKLQMFSGAVGPSTPLSLGPVSSAKSTAIGVASNVLTVTIANSLKVGQFVYLQSFTAGGAINGSIVQVVTASSTQFTANIPTANITAATADTTGTYQLVQAGPGNLLQLGTSATITNSLATSSLLTMTCANTFVPGQFVIIQGLTNGATANGVIVQILTASSTQFTATWTGTSFLTGADSGTATLLVTAGSTPITTNTAAAITNSLATASSAGTAGLITLTALQAFVPGNLVVIHGLTNGAAINGDVLAVLNSSSLTGKIFTANGQTAAVSTGADSGTAALIVTGTSSTSAISNTELQAGTDMSGQAFNLLVVGL